jgi:hypothetical protein
MKKEDKEFNEDNVKDEQEELFPLKWREGDKSFKEGFL